MALNDGYVYRETVGTAHGRTALEHLVDRYRHSPREAWQARLARGEVTLDGVPARGDEALRAGMTLCWHRPAWEEPDAPTDWGLVYEDAHVLAVVKPSGLPTLPSGGYLQHTLLHQVQRRYPGAAPLHRLGRATTGLVLFTRTHEAAVKLSADWREGRVHKRYRALSAGVAAQDAYDINAAIGLVPHPRLGAVHGARAEGKPSRSTARVLERREAETLFEVDLHTGRPEQIRIHLAYIGHPLVGDPLFVAGGVPRAHEPGLPGDGGYLLHAGELSFTHPATGQETHLRAPPPAPLRSRAEAAQDVSSR